MPREICICDRIPLGIPVRDNLGAFWAGGLFTVWARLLVLRSPSSLAATITALAKGSGASSRNNRDGATARVLLRPKPRDLALDAARAAGFPRSGSGVGRALAQSHRGQGSRGEGQTIEVRATRRKELQKAEGSRESGQRMRCECTPFKKRREMTGVENKTGGRKKPPTPPGLEPRNL